MKPPTLKYLIQEGFINLYIYKLNEDNKYRVHLVPTVLIKFNGQDIKELIEKDEGFVHKYARNTGGEDIKS